MGIRVDIATLVCTLGHSFDVVFVALFFLSSIFILLSEPYLLTIKWSLPRSRLENTRYDLFATSISILIQFRASFRFFSFVVVLRASFVNVYATSNYVFETARHGFRLALGLCNMQRSQLWKRSCPWHGSCLAKRIFIDQRGAPFVIHNLFKRHKSPFVFVVACQYMAVLVVASGDRHGHFIFFIPVSFLHAITNLPRLRGG